MNTNTSTRGTIRFRRYQCRSHAGGRPPCPSVSLNAWDIEEFIAEQIGKWEDSTELAKVFRDEWPAMVTEKRQELLNDYVAKITYNDDDGQVDIEMNREAVARFVEAQAREANGQSAAGRGRSQKPQGRWRTQSPSSHHASPEVAADWEAARRTTSQNNLKQIALALYVFHERHGKLPALYSTDASGKPLLSWRVHLLPYLENGELYRRFRLDEPWDSEHNRALLSEMPTVYRCPETADDRFVTNYLAISSESSFLTLPAKAMFGATTPLGISMKQVTDGTSNTIAIVEVSDGRACEWTRPQDFLVVADMPLDGLGHARDPKVFLTAFGDGSTRVLSRDLDLKSFLGLTTRNGGELVDSP